MGFVHAIFAGRCPNCGGDISDERLMLGVPCRRCLPSSVEELRELRERTGDPYEFKKLVLGMLKERGTHKKFSRIISVDTKLRRFEKFFAKVTGGYKLWSAQRSWAKRVLRGESFTIIAPTGVGKTVFGSAMALYLARRGKAYIILPTTLLVKQVYERVSGFLDRWRKEIRVVAYHALLPNSKRREALEAISSGEFDLLITTSQFLSKNFDKVSVNTFRFIFVDDVDALLKASRNIDRVLMLIGFDEEIIADALKLVKAKARLVAKREDRELMAEAKRLAKKIKRYRREMGRRLGQLVISSATGRPRGLKVKVFRELLGFEVGATSELLRNVADLYVEPKGALEDEVVRVVKTLGAGGLVFVPIDRGVEYAGRLADTLRDAGLNVGVVHAGAKKNVLEDFSQGKIDVLVGVASYYGLLVRGIDLPHRIRYAVFAGIPKFRFDLSLENVHPFRIAQLLSNVAEHLEEHEREAAERIMVRLQRFLSRASPAVLKRVQEAIYGGEAEPQIEYIVSQFREALKILRKALSDEDVRRRVEASGLVAFRLVEGRLKIVIPDTLTYIQASGRTSRLYAGGISRGISVVIVDDKKIFDGMVRQLSWYLGESTWQRFEEADLKGLMGEVNRDRERIRMIMEGRIPPGLSDPIKSALMVVESPNKARTIASFFGRPSRRRVGGVVAYEVATGNYLLTLVASGGHIYDLSVMRGVHGVAIEDGRFYPIYVPIKRCRDCGEQFVDHDRCPVCGSRNILDKSEVVRVLQELASENDVVLIGTDPDVEGEKIGWDLAVSLAPYTGRIVRVEFHEVTKPAILRAISGGREIDMRMVEAQMIRRIEDRWIGFELSRRLWERFGKRYLSAGRVQTPVLGWIIRRFDEFRESIHKVLYVELENGLKLRFEGVEGAEEVGEALIRDLSEEVVELNPPPPYTTDEMIREASRYGLGAEETMSLAQDLFEMGLITYHRTDSTRVSSHGISIAREYISEKFGEKLFKGRVWGEGGAHETIRPTRPIDVDRLKHLLSIGALRTVKPLTRRHMLLYGLIFARFIASQMAPAKLVLQRYTVDLGFASTRVEGYVDAPEPGFTLVRPVRMLPRVSEGRVGVAGWEVREEPSVYPYTQGEVVEEMKRRGIGRPSTYAKIVGKLLKRYYVVESKKRRLVPTTTGRKVYNFLINNYGEFVSEERTRALEEKMAMVERGEASYTELISDLYKEILRLP